MIKFLKGDLLIAEEFIVSGISLREFQIKEFSESQEMEM
jgi:hypothetical protein